MPSKFEFFSAVAFAALVGTMIWYLTTQTGGDEGGENPGFSAGDEQQSIVINGFNNSIQCPSEAQKRIDGVYTRIMFEGGDVMRNGFPMWQNGNNYKIVKAYDSMGFNIFTDQTNLETAKDSDRIALLKIDGKVESKLGCPTDADCADCSVDLNGGVTLTQPEPSDTI